MAADDWSDNPTAEHDFMYLEYDDESYVSKAFTDTFDIVLSGASSLLATAACVTALALAI